MPAIGPQLPHTLVFETRASSPVAVCSSITNENGMIRATSSMNFRSTAGVVRGILVGSGRPTDR